jgi:uncharacterized protein DUF6527
MATLDVPATFGQKIINWDAPFDKDGRQERRDIPPGSCEWVENQAGEIGAMNFVCPCGCGKTHSATLHLEGADGNGWMWNGNREKPTLTPSIGCRTPCGWHGYLTDGVFRAC